MNDHEAIKELSPTIPSNHFSSFKLNHLKEYKNLNQAPRTTINFTTPSKPTTDSTAGQTVDHYMWARRGCNNNVDVHEKIDKRNRENIKQLLAETNLVKVDVPGDGDCFYHALVAAFSNATVQRRAESDRTEADNFVT